MENTPKLLPLWHSVTLRDTLEKKSFQTPMHIYADHGGAGIDVHYENGDIQFEKLKSSVNLVNFKAETCALPLLPPNKINSLFEPCMEQLLKDKENEYEFFHRALGIHSSMKRYSSMRDCVMKLSRKVQKLARKGRYDKIKAPESILQLAKTFPKHLPVPRARWIYTGGSLSTLKYSDGYILLHPVGRKLESLAITPLKESDEGYNGIHSDVDNQKKVAISGRRSKIFQISVANAPISSYADFCCVRQRKMYHYIWLKQPEEENLYPMESYMFDEQLSDVKLSNYIPGEHVVVTVGGKLFLQDAEQKKTVWQSAECLSHDPIIEDNWWGCDFGSHPRSVLYADRMQFTALDLRTKGTGCVKILSLPNPFFQEGGAEQILMNKQLDVNHFQHIIATDLHLFIFDERYPQQPMNTWNHMLESVPLYCDVKTYKSSMDATDLVVLLGSQKSQDIASFHINCSKSRIQPFSLTHPCHVSSPRDSTRNLELQCVSLHDDVLKRTSAPLIGVTVVPYDKETGYSVIQLTSFGDVFHQEFTLCASDSVEEKTFRVEPGCTLVPATSIMSRMSSWLEEAVVSKEEKKQERSSMDGASYMFADREKMEEDLLSTKCAIRCVICNQPSEESADGSVCDNSVVDCDVCPRCGLHVDYGKQLLETYENFGVLAGPFASCSNDSDNDDDNGSPKELQLIDFDTIIDPLAKMVLKEWPERKSKKVLDAEQMPDQENTSSFIFPEREPFTQAVAGETLPLSVTPSVTKDSSGMHSLTFEEDFSPSQDLFPSQKSVSPIKNKPKRIKLNSSFGF